MTKHFNQVFALLGMAFGAGLFLFVTGVSLTTSAVLVLVLAIQSWGGWAIWRTLRASASVIEVVGMSIGVGTALSALSGIAVRAVFDTSLGWILPAVVGVGLVISRYRKEPGTSSTHVRVDLGVILAVAFGLIAGMAGLLLVSIRSYPLTWSGNWSGYHGDMLFFEALGSSLAGWGPLASIFSPDMVVRYHWLVYGWTGFLTQVTEADPFMAITRVVPLLTLIVAVFLAAAWTRRLTQVSWAPLLGVALIVTGGYVGASYGTVLNFDSPSTSLTTVWLMAGVLIALQRLENRTARWPTLVLIAILSAATTAGKVSTGFLLITTLAVIAAIGFIRSSAWRNDAVIGFAIGSVTALITYLLVIAGSADPGGLGLLSLVDRASSVQGLNPIPGFAGAALGTGILSVAVAMRWAGSLWLIRDRATRWSPTSAAAVGLALGGLLPLLLVSGGVNETWFALSASAPLSVLSAGGIGRFVATLKDQSTPINARLLIAIGGSFVLWIVLWFLWSSGPSGGNIWEYTLRWSGPISVLAGAIFLGSILSRSVPVPGAMLGFTILIVILVAVPGRLASLSPSPTGTQPGTRGELFGSEETFANGLDQEFIIGWSDIEVAAGKQLRNLTSRKTLIATNHTFSPLVTALSGRQTFVSGMHYQAPYGWPGNIETLLERERQSWAFIDSPSPETWEPLCNAGVTHLWIDPARTGSSKWNDWGDILLDTQEVILVEIKSQEPGKCAEAFVAGEP